MTAASGHGRSRANQRMKLTGAAILVSRGMKVLQAAPAAYPYRSAEEVFGVTEAANWTIATDLSEPRVYRTISAPTPVRTAKGERTAFARKFVPWVGPAPAA